MYEIDGDTVDGARNITVILIYRRRELHREMPLKRRRGVGAGFEFGGLSATARRTNTRKRRVRYPLAPMPSSAACTFRHRGGNPLSPALPHTGTRYLNDRQINL